MTTVYRVFYTNEDRTQVLRIVIPVYKTWVYLHRLENHGILPRGLDYWVRL